MRFVSDHFSTHLLRADWEVASPAAAEVEQRIIDTALAALPRADVVRAVRLRQGSADARG